MYDAEHIVTLDSRVTGPKALGKCQPWILLHLQKPHFRMLQLNTRQGSDLDILEGEDTKEITGFSVFKDQSGKNTQGGKNTFYQRASAFSQKRKPTESAGVKRGRKTWKQQPSSAGASRGLPRAA